MKHTTFFKKIVYVLSVAFLSLVILEACLRLGGTVFLLAQDYRNRAALNQKNNYKILCLGESTTALGSNSSYPSQLETILNQKSSNKKFSVINKGVPAIRSHEILLQLEKNLETYKPDIVITMLGINDTWDAVTDKPVFIGQNKNKRTLKIIRLAQWLFRNLIEKKTPPSHKLPPVTFSVAKNIEEMKALKTAEARLKEDINNDPNNANLYFDLGLCFLDQSEYIKSEETLENALKIDPDYVDAYYELGVSLQHQGRYDEAEKALIKAIPLAPHYWPTYVQLEAVYRIQGKYKEAKKFLEVALIEYPYIHWLHFGLAMCYKEEGNYEKAKESFKKAIELDERNENIWAYIELGRYYRRMGKDEKADEMFRAALSIDENNPWASYELDNPENIIQKPRLDNPVTYYNYRKIAESVTARRIALVAVQYPMRNIQSLKKALAPYKEETFFVDNETSFKKAIMENGYKKYFSDKFGGDFGHATPEGNRILAENIANTILHEVLR